ncbi:MAG: hypothetical protein HC910_11125 [Spirulinaceae cyanobacterium SM2_1_0]|nr:hypothetical protein [Spirulinaceae cyanobacterium SM2_1_0]
MTDWVEISPTDPDCTGTVQIHRVLRATQARLQERSPETANGWKITVICG